MGRIGPDTGATQSNHVFVTLIQVLNPPFEFPYIRVDQAFLLPQVLLLRLFTSRSIEVLVAKVRHIRRSASQFLSDFGISCPPVCCYP
jgi:hypothetical protein